MTAILAKALSYFTPCSSLTSRVVPEWQSLLRPEWETVIYRFFIFSAIAAMIFWVRYSEKIAYLRRFLCVELIMTAFILGALFKSVVYIAHPELAKTALIIFLIIAVLTKLLWWLFLYFFKPSFGFAKKDMFDPADFLIC